MQTQITFLRAILVSFTSFYDFPFYGKFDVVIFQVPNVEGNAVFVFGFPESVVIVIVPQLKGPSVMPM